ncbi:MAG: protein kinase [Oscillospiraceae bacterium]
MFDIGYTLDGRYEISEILGSGGGGVVYKAYQKSVGRYVAIKLIKDNICKSIDIHGEADVLKKLKHNYIPAVYDFVIENDNVYTVMEFVEGETLETILKKNRKLTQKQIIKYARQLCEVVQYLHSQNPPIIHSDIKPANIIITPKDDICLIDYNISLALTGEQAAIGVSEGYSAPEQYRIKKQTAVNQETLIDSVDDETLFTEIDTEYTKVTKALIPETELTETQYTEAINQKAVNVTSRIDARADIYSIGATLYHLITGEKPVVSYETVAPIDAIKQNISESLAAIVNKSMAKAPSDRFKSAAQMYKALIDLHKSDRKYKLLVIKQEITVIILIVFMAAALMVSFMGYRKTDNDILEEYTNCITQMDNMSSDEMKSIYDDAVKISPLRAEAHEKIALALYNEKKYNEVCELLNGIEKENLFEGNQNVPYAADKMYYLMGSSYFELEDYRSSAEAFNKAVLINTTEALYYRDYAVSLARCGDVSKAEDVLEHAKTAGLSDDSIAYAQGEILFSSCNYKESIKSFQSCISGSTDEDMIYRAYMICGSAYAEAYSEGSVTAEERISFLVDAVNLTDLEKAMPLYEMLSQAYIDAGNTTDNTEYYSKAILAIEKMNSFGWRNYNSDNNLIILYQKIGNLVSAKKLAEDMFGVYGEDYSIYKRLAFIEVENQNSQDADKRDYSEFLNYYNKAAELYNDDTDMEMLLLDDVFEQLKNGNWL